MVENATQIKSGITINVGASAKIQKNTMCPKKDYSQNPTTYTCEHGKQLGNIIDDLVITCDEVIDAIVKLYDEATKTISTKRTSTNIYILAFLLITIVLLTAVSIYCHQIKHRSKQKHWRITTPVANFKKLILLI